MPPGFPVYPVRRRVMLTNPVHAATAARPPFQLTNHTGNLLDFSHLAQK
jgi:hypothetical protein